MSDIPEYVIKFDFEKYKSPLVDLKIDWFKEKDGQFLFDFKENLEEEILKGFKNESKD